MSAAESTQIDNSSLFSVGSQLLPNLERPRDYILATNSEWSDLVAQYGIIDESHIISFTQTDGQLDGPYSFRCKRLGELIEEEIKTQFLDHQHVQAMICKRLGGSSDIKMFVEGSLFDGIKLTAIEDGMLVTVEPMTTETVPVRLTLVDSNSSSSIQNGGYSNRYTRPKNPHGAVGLSNLGIVSC